MVARPFWASCVTARAQNPRSPCAARWPSRGGLSSPRLNRQEHVECRLDLRGRARPHEADGAGLAEPPELSVEVVSRFELTIRSNSATPAAMSG